MLGARQFADFAHAARDHQPRIALVLGSGMGQVAARVRPIQRLSFIDVPDMQATSVIGHSGQVTLGEWAGQCVILFEGRLHFYECQSWRAVTAPVRTARFLGAQVLLMTNAAGGIRPDLHPGSLMAIRQHIEWNRPSCWRQAPSSPYSERLRTCLATVAADQGFPLSEGVYAAVTGPSYETPAEIRALRTWGADAVGMSTTREIQAAHEVGLECAALSLITNRAAGLGDGPLHHDEVVLTAAAQAERLGDLIEGFLIRS